MKWLNRSCYKKDVTGSVSRWTSQQQVTWEVSVRVRVRVLSSLLQNNRSQMDNESLRTLMCEAEAIVNSRLLTVNQLAYPDSPSPLTPNHLLTMKSKVVFAPPGAFQPTDVYCRKRWRRVQHLANEFWTWWGKEFLLSLQQQTKWTHPKRNLSIDNIVVIKDENISHSLWQLAHVSAVYPSLDGQVRKVQVALADSCLHDTGRRVASVRYLKDQSRNSCSQCQLKQIETGIIPSRGALTRIELNWNDNLIYEHLIV